MKNAVLLLFALLLAGQILRPFEAVASEADAILPEEFSNPRPLNLSPESERAAQAAALYLQALLEEESEGPDKALETKRQVLELDPGFSELAVESAHQYLRRGETTDAITVLKDAAKAQPKNTGPALALATIYLRQLQKPDLAERYALQALAAAPDDAGGYEALWEISRVTGAREKADGVFQRALKRSSAPPEFWLRLADLRLREAGGNGKMSDVETAAITEFLDRAVRSGADAHMLARAGDYFVAFSQIERAVELYSRALALKPGLEGVRERLAACLLQSGSPSEAITLLEENIKTNPLDLRSYDLLGKIYWESGDFPKALSKLRQSLLIADPAPRRYDELIRLSFLTNDPKAAREFAQEAEKSFPDSVEFTLYRAIAHSEQNEHEDAMKAFEQVVVQAGISRPDLLDAEFYFTYGVAAEKAGRIAKAAQIFLKSIELDPERSAKACNYLGYMWADRNENLDEAEKLIRRALAFEPNNGAYLDSLGWVLFRKGRFEEALTELLRSTAALEQPDPVVLDHLGDTYEKLGRIAEAVLYWQKALQIDPANPSLTGKVDKNAARVARQPQIPTPQTPDR
ncbi:MAG: tetratricopeptide repeat protein [Terrimicrobiaceae bacterium]